MRLLPWQDSSGFPAAPTLTPTTPVWRNQRRMAPTTAFEFEISPNSPLNGRTLLGGSPAAITPFRLDGASSSAVAYVYARADWDIVRGVC